MPVATGDTEVCQLGMEIWGLTSDHDVLQLDVSVHEVPLVQGLQSTQQLNHESGYQLVAWFLRDKPC